MRDDPSSSVRHEVHHVLDEDSGLGKRLETVAILREIEESIGSDDEWPAPHSLGWRKRGKPLQKGRPIVRKLKLRGLVSR